MLWFKDYNNVIHQSVSHQRIILHHASILCMALINVEVAFMYIHKLIE